MFEQPSLPRRAELVLHSHPSELEPQNQLSEGPLDEVVECCQNDDCRAVLASTSRDIIPDLPPDSNVALTGLVENQIEVPKKFRHGFEFLSYDLDSLFVFSGCDPIKVHELR